MNTIATPEFTLEPQVAAHAEDMFALLRDPALYVYENEPPPSLAWLRTRFARLESRRSADGKEQWLNWVVRLPTGEHAGFVQATVRADASSLIAYVMGSRYWGRGLATRAVQAMLDELAAHHGVRLFLAVFKRDNARSQRLLERLGFSNPSDNAGVDLEPGERVMVKG